MKKKEVMVRDANTVLSVLQKAADTCYELGMLMQHEKNVFHIRGLQGFKRCFRYASRQYFERGMEMECIMIDHYNGFPISESEFENPGYSGTCTNHLELVCRRLWEAESKMNDIIAVLVSHQEYFAIEKVKKYLSSIQKEIKYMQRHLQFLADTNEDPSQLYWYSKELHDDMKCLEECKHNRHYD